MYLYQIMSIKRFINHYIWISKMKDITADEKLPYIPETFTLGCHTFKVQLYRELYDGNDPLYGQFDYDEQIIRIRIFKDNGELLSRECILNTYYHELFHAFNYLWNTGSDESLASTFAMLICEYETTKKYAKKESINSSSRE